MLARLYPRIHHQQSHKSPTIVNIRNGYPTTLRLTIIGTYRAAIERLKSKKIQRTRASEYRSGFNETFKRLMRALAT